VARTAARTVSESLGVPTRLHVERRRRRQRQFTESSTATTAASNSGTVTSEQPQSTAHPSVDDSVQRRRDQNPTSNRRRRREATSSRRRTRSDRGPTPDSSKKFSNSSEVDPRLVCLPNVRTILNHTSTKPFNLKIQSIN